MRTSTQLIPASLLMPTPCSLRTSATLATRLFGAPLCHGSDLPEVTQQLTMGLKEASQKALVAAVVMDDFCLGVFKLKLVLWFYSIF